jgi:FKBP-type peptidyl-prolyl cis-trans isomerase
MRNFFRRAELEETTHLSLRGNNPMRKPFAFALMLAAAMGLAACDKASEDKAQDAQEHREQAQEKMSDAQDKMNDAAKENAEAAKDQAEAEQKAAQEAAPATPAPTEPAKQ